MKTIGVRCSNSDYAYGILSGSKIKPVVEAAKRVAFPKNYSEAEILNWFYQEMEALFSNKAFDAVGIKRAETTVKRSNSLETRIQCGAIAILAASQAGCQTISRKVNSTISKDLGMKGKGSYLKTKFDTTPLSNFNDYSAKIQEAILVAWSFM